MLAAWFKGATYNSAYQLARRSTLAYQTARSTINSVSMNVRLVVHVLPAETTSKARHLPHLWVETTRICMLAKLHWSGETNPNEPMPSHQTGK